MQRNLFILLLTLFFLAGCASSGDLSEDMSARELYREAKKNLDNGFYEEAISLYEKLGSRFLYGRYTQQAQLELAYAHYKFDEPDMALLATDRFIKLYPTHASVDYAYYLRGLASYSMNRQLMEKLFDQDPTERNPKAVRQAFQHFSDLVERFPNSRYTKDSIERMIYLRNSLAQYEIHVANYYLKRDAYLAAANRAKYVIENYQHTPAVEDALAIMVKAYRKLELYELANDAKRVLDLNHPDHQTPKESTGS